jgi:SAM-dependent methyltransferase
LETVRTFFERAYSSVDRYWWNVAHAYSTIPEDHAGSLLGQETLRIARERTPGRAIDLGSGEGADAIRLARLGWEVEAVELTETGAAKISHRAREIGVRVKVHRKDVRDFQPSGSFDIVICNGVLHYIEAKEDICTKLKDMTNVGGINVVSLWSDYTPVPESHQVVPTFPDSERGVVVNAYNGWIKRLLYFERGKLEQSHGDMATHVHSHIKLIAVRRAVES